MGFFTVVPAHAGMIPIVFSELQKIVSCTRTRGDDPKVEEIDETNKELYPHTRG